MTATAKLALEDGTVFNRQCVWRKWGSRRRGLLQHQHDRISGDPDRSELPWADRHDDLPRKSANYGVNAQDVESRKLHLSGFVVRELSRRASSFRSDEELDGYLLRHNVLGIEGIDTRALGPPAPHRGSHAGSPLDGRPGRRQSRGQGQGQPRPGRTRSGSAR